MRKLKGLSITFTVAAMVVLCFQNCQKNQDLGSSDTLTQFAVPGTSGLTINSYSRDGTSTFTICGSIAADAALGITWTNPNSMTSPTVWYTPNGQNGFNTTRVLYTDPSSDTTEYCTSIPFAIGPQSALTSGGYSATVQIVEGVEGQESAVYDITSPDPVVVTTPTPTYYP